MSQRLPLGRAATLRRGTQLTHRQLEPTAAGLRTGLRSSWPREGIDAELIDLRCIWPWDRDAVLASCARTGHLLVVHEAVQVGGFGAEIAATAAEATGCKIKRLGAPRIPVGYSPVLEAQSRVGVADIVAAAKALRG